MADQPPERPGPLRRVFWLALKLSVSGVVIILLLNRVDTDQIWQHSRSISLQTVLLVLGLKLLQIPFSASRWRLIATRLGSTIGLSDAIRLTWVGLFFNNFLPGSMGGDFVRAWLLQRFHVDLKRSVLSVFIDRASAFLVLLALVAGGLPFLIAASLPSTFILAVAVTLIASLFLFGALVLVTYGPIGALRRFRPISYILEAIRIGVQATWSRRVALRLIANALIIHGITISAVYLIVYDVGADISFLETFIVVPTVIVILSVPISFAGWGMREGAMALLLGMVGATEAEAVAVSIGWGLALLISSAPGIFFWLKLRH